MQGCSSAPLSAAGMAAIDEAFVLLETMRMACIDRQVLARDPWNSDVMIREQGV